jgi:hypothetical protein
MIARQSAVGGQYWKLAVPLFGNATNIVKGAAIVRGTTAGTNQGFGIVAPSNSSMSSGLFLGVTEQPFNAATIDNDPSAGTKYLKADLCVDPKQCYEAQYDNALTAGVFTNGLTMTAVTTATPSVTVTSLENISGGWLFFDNGELHYVLSVSSGVATLKTATSAAISTANKVAKILPLFDPLLTLTTTADKIGIGTAAQGGVQATVLENYIRSVGFDNVLLDPTKTDNIIFPIVNGVFPAIYSLIQFTQSALGTH